jgi:hypothetical protein
MKKPLIISAILLVAVLAGFFTYNFYWKPDNFLRQIYLVPADAMFIIETDAPVDNWHRFGESAPWQYLRKQETMAEMNKMAQRLDSLLQENESLMSLLGKRNLMISAHTTRRGDYDFLFVVDTQKASKMETLKTQLENLFESMDFKVTTREFGAEKILELFDPADRTTLYLSFIDNHLIASYTGSLVEKSIREKDNPTIGRDFYFQEIEQQLSGSSLCRIYINYNHFDKYLNYMMGTADPDVRDFCRSMQYTGLLMNISDEQMNFKGFTNLKDSTDSYLAALQQSGSAEITAQQILSNRTAFFVTMGFDNALNFMDNVENILKNDAETWQSFQKNREKIENFLDIDIRDNFLSWMEGEVVFAQNTPGSLGYQNEFVAVIKMKDKDAAIENLNFIEERIRKKTPIEFKTINYEGYDIHYLEIKGFFKLLFGGMFERLDKPYYTVIEDYAVFSNSPATLLSMIEDYRLEQTLDRDEAFDDFMDEFNSRSSLFVYANSQKSFPLWKNLLSSSTWQSVEENKNFILCFPQTGFQLTADGMLFDTRAVFQFREPQPEIATDDIEVAEDDELSLAEDTLSNLQLFYVEKMTGNVYTEFYDDGSIKSQTEMKDGIRQGKYREFYPSGKLKIYGKYKNDLKNKTWHFYNEDETLLRKEKWRNGELK